MQTRLGMRQASCPGCALEIWRWALPGQDWTSPLHPTAHRPLHHDTQCMSLHTAQWHVTPGRAKHARRALPARPLCTQVLKLTEAELQDSAPAPAPEPKPLSPLLPHLYLGAGGEILLAQGAEMARLGTSLGTVLLS